MRITELILNLNFGHEQLIDYQNGLPRTDESIYNNKQYLLIYRNTIDINFNKEIR